MTSIQEALTTSSPIPVSNRTNAPARAGDNCSQPDGCPHLDKYELGCCTPVITEELVEWAKDRTGRASNWNCPFYTGNSPV